MASSINGGERRCRSWSAELEYLVGVFDPPFLVINAYFDEAGAPSCFTYPTTNSISSTGAPSPNTCAQPPRVSMYSRIRHILPLRTSYTKQ